MTEREPDWDTIAEQEIEARTDAVLGDAPFRCSDPPEESCWDAGCPVHGEDGDGTNWWDDDPAAAPGFGIADDWPGEPPY